MRTKSVTCCRRIWVTTWLDAGRAGRSTVCSRPAKKMPPGTRSGAVRRPPKRSPAGYLLRPVATRSVSRQQMHARPSGSPYSTPMHISTDPDADSSPAYKTACIDCSISTWMTLRRISTGGFSLPAVEIFRPPLLDSQTDPAASWRMKRLPVRCYNSAGTPTCVSRNA